jgi:hypothetical protein
MFFWASMNKKQEKSSNKSLPRCDRLSTTTSPFYAESTSNKNDTVEFSNQGQSYRNDRKKCRGVFPCPPENVPRTGARVKTLCYLVPNWRQAVKVGSLLVVSTFAHWVRSLAALPDRHLASGSLGDDVHDELDPIL